MFTPCTHPTIRPFYAIGNSPAVNLTESLPQGVDADVLLLGCGDARHILFTSYAELDLPERRKLDVTCCDIERNILARNALVLSLILDGEQSASSDQIWRIHYDLYLDDLEMGLLAAQAEKLAGFSTLADWHAGPYGETLRFCDARSFSLVQSVWAQCVASVKRKDAAEYKAKFEDDRRHAEKYKNLVWGEGYVSYTSARAGAPLWMDMAGELTEATELSWRTGRSTKKPAASAMFPNPMFAVGMSDHSLHLGFSDPTVGFHLAPAYANLTALSPLRVEDDPSEVRLFQTARFLFKQWANAFRGGSSRMVVRFVAADCFSLCQTLQCNAETGETSANWYQLEGSFHVLELGEADYGKEGKAPRKFDVIDTSNISDYSGALNLLVSAGPLLKDNPWSGLYTEIMARGSTSHAYKFEDLLCGHTTTIALLLGLAPIECWTNVKSVSAADEIMLAATQISQTNGDVKIQSRLSWKLDRYLRGQDLPVSQLLVLPSDMLSHAYQVYQDMFQHESLATYRSASNPAASQLYPKHHRGSFVAYLKTLLQTVLANNEDLGVQLVEKLVDDRALAVGTNHLQALCLELSFSSVFRSPALETQVKYGLSKASFCKWTSILNCVAVTLVVPPSRWQKAYKLAKSRESSLVLEGHIECASETTSSYHNIFSDVQIAFGTVTTRGSRDRSDFSLAIEEDESRWKGSSTMIASFYVSTGALQHDIPCTEVSLRIHISPMTVVSFGGLGPQLAVFSSRLTDEKDLYISRFRPGQNGYHIVGGTHSLKRSSSINCPEPARNPSFTVNIDRKSGDLSTITGRVEITTDQGKKLLADKVPIELRQASPFTIEIVFGKRALVIPVTFQGPVDKDGCKTRIARTSCYVEVIAPLAPPLTSRALEGYMLPTVLARPSSLPVTLNAPHLSLDTLPILSLEDRKRIGFLSPFCKFFFSARELRLREQIQSASESGVAPSPRLNYKESLLTMFLIAAGLQGGQTGLFGVAREKDGIHILIMVSAIRLNGAGAGIVLDAAALPLMRDMMEDHLLDDFLLILRTLELCQIKADDEELLLWKRTLPALAERCRTWEHNPKTCEYAKAGQVPVSLEDGKQVLCSCGRGKFPKNFSPLPEWDKASKYATRIAISPVFSSAFVEDVVDPQLRKTMHRVSGGGGGGTGVSVPSNPIAPMEACRCCGRTDAKPGGGPLKKCMRCLQVKYCSAECQKKDWKKHRMECEEPEV